MNSTFLTTLIAILLGITFDPVARATLTTNNWNDGSGKWELGANWSAGTPSPANAINFVTGGIPVGPRVITIDVATVSSNVINSCLIISNLTVGGTSFAPNTLFVNNASDTPGTIGLSVANGLTISSHGALSITNSRLLVGSFNLNGDGIFDDGFVLLNTGTINTSAGTVSIGYNGSGQMTVQNGKWQATGVVVGNNAGSHGTLTIAGGTVDSAGNGLTVGQQAGSAGTLWLIGGQLIETNNATSIGFNGVGQMTVSNGTWQCALVGVGAQGTLTIAGGVSTVFLQIGEIFTPGTGVVWMTGGQLLGSADIGEDAFGQMTVSNGLWQADTVAVGDDTSGGYGAPGTGTLTIAGGSNILSSLYLGYVTNCLGTVWLTGGSLIVTNVTTVLTTGS